MPTANSLHPVAVASRQSRAEADGLTRARALHQTGAFEAAAAAARSVLADADAADERRRAEAATLLAAILAMAGEPDGLPSLLAESARIEPDNTAWRSDLGLLRLLSGDLAGAEALLAAATASADADAVAFNRQGVVRLALGDPDGAAKAFAEAVLRDPNRADWESNLGGVLIRLERLEDALVHYERALTLDPDLRQALDGRAAVLIALERPGEAIQRLEEEVARTPDSVPARRRLARALGLDDRFQEAEDSLRAALACAGDGDAADLRLELAEILARQDRYPAVRKVLDEALEEDGENLAALVMKARASVELRLFDDATAALDAAAAKAPQALGVLLARAELNCARERPAEADSDLRQAIALYPGSPAAHAQLGHVHMWVGRLDEAIACFEKAAQMNPGAFAALVNAHRFPEDEATTERMLRFARNPLIPSEARASMEFALADVYEARGAFDAAFAHVERANGLVRRAVRYDPDRFTRQVDATMRVFSSKTLARCRGMGVASERPVFVVGMPRSGTTLTEQVLASHPLAFGAGELPVIPAITHMMPKVVKARRPYPWCMSRFSARTAEHAAIYYLKKLHALDGTAGRVVDKLPHNFLHLGLISILFPQARIIHVRRDPRDVAVSNYFQNFKAKRGGMGYAFDLCHIGRQIRDHDRVMDHWRRVLPGPILDLDYEDLVGNFEAAARRLLDFVGLPWSEEVLAFHETERPIKTASVWQVRQPLYQSSKEKWRRYAAYLGPLEESLAGR